MMTDKDREQGGPFPSMLASRKAAEVAKEKGLTGIHIKVRARGSQYSRSPGMGAQYKRLNPLSGPWLEHQYEVEFAGLRIGTIEDVTPVTHGELRNVVN